MKAKEAIKALRSPLFPLIRARAEESLRIGARFRPGMLLEAQAPREGVYYIIRNPEGWAVLPFFAESEYHDHASAWPEVALLIAYKWHKKLGKQEKQVYREIEHLTYAFPRGRVDRQGGARGKYLLAHGGDVWDKKGKGTPPTNISLNEVRYHFGLTPANSIAEYDSHEQVQESDKDELRRVLKLRENWKSVSADFGWDD